MNRRQNLALFGGIGAALGLGAAGMLRAAEPAQGKAGTMAQMPWPYKPLDPDVAGQRGFDSYLKGHCMYGSFDAVVMAVADQLGEPYTTFPAKMFVYGAGGVQGWGTLCGALNGAAAAIQMLSANPEPVTDALYRWYEHTALPDFEPKGMKFRNVASVAGSPLCHPSIAKWCERSGLKSYSDQRKERCGVLTGAVARKTVMLLNEQQKGLLTAVMAPDSRTGTCMTCHEKGGMLENMRSKQTCNSCHTDETLAAHKHQKIAIKSL